MRARGRRIGLINRRGIAGIQVRAALCDIRLNVAACGVRGSGAHARPWVQKTQRDTTQDQDKCRANSKIQELTPPSILCARLFALGLLLPIGHPSSLHEAEFLLHGTLLRLHHPQHGLTVHIFKRKVNAVRRLIYRHGMGTEG